MTQLSTHILIDPSFLGKIRAGMAHGLRLSSTKLSEIISSTCLLDLQCIFRVHSIDELVWNDDPGNDIGVGWFLFRGKLDSIS